MQFLILWSERGGKTFHLTTKLTLAEKIAPFQEWPVLQFFKSRFVGPSGIEVLDIMDTSEECKNDLFLPAAKRLGLGLV